MRLVAINTASLLAARGIRLGASFFLAVLMARNLGAKGYGQWIALTSLATLLAPWIAMGLDKIAIRECVDQERIAPEYMGAVLSLRIKTGLVATAVLVLISRFFFGFQGKILVVAFMVGLVYLLNSLTGSAIVAYRIREKMWWEGSLNALKDLILLGLVILAISWSKTLASIGGAYLAGALMFMGTTYLILKSRFFLPTFHYQPNLPKKLLRLGFPVALAIFCNNFQDVSRVLVEGILGSRAAGLYGVAGMPLRGAELLAVSFAAAFFPTLSRFYRNSSTATHILQRAGVFLIALGLGLAIPICCFPQKIIFILFGDSFLPAASTMGILAGAVILIPVNHLFYGAMVASGKEKKFALLMSIASGFNLILTFFLIYFFDIIGAGLGSVGTQVFIGTIFSFQLRNKLGKFPLSGRIFWLIPCAGLGFLTSTLWTRNGGTFPMAMGAGVLIYLLGAALVVRWCWCSASRTSNMTKDNQEETDI